LPTATARRVFYHAEIDNQIDNRYEGRGLGTIVVGAALEAIRNAGMRIVPSCDVVARCIDKHPEFSVAGGPPTPEWVDGNKYRYT
jgi:uncharacterized protein